MASSYVPTSVEQGHGQEVSINKNNADIKTALDEALTRATSSDNALEGSLDIAGHPVLNLRKPIEPTEPVRLDDLNSLAVTEVVQNYASADSPITIDIDSVTYAIVVVTSDITINFTGGLTEGQQIQIRLEGSGVGHNIQFDAKAAFSADLPDPSGVGTLLKLDNDVDYIVFRRNLVEDTYDFMAMNRGF